MSNHITGHTGLLCLLGSPVAHSVSPEMHNEACNQLGLDYTYLAFDVPEDQMPKAVEGLRTMGARGWNITMPGKNIMCRLADKVSPASEISGACNTIVNDNGVLTAYTTDGVGFMRAVAENDVDIIGKKMTVWHYYNGVHQAAFDKLVEEFNGTVGKDLGIYVEETSKGSVSDLESAIRDAVNTEVGAEDMPDVFSTYTDSAYVLQKDGVLTDLTQYFTQEELDQYVDAYVKEGLWKIMN